MLVYIATVVLLLVVFRTLLCYLEERGASKFSKSSRLVTSSDKFLLFLVEFNLLWIEFVGFNQVDFEKSSTRRVFDFKIRCRVIPGEMSRTCDILLREQES